MSYSFKNFEATRAKDGKVEKGEAGYVDNMRDLCDFIFDYQYCQHDQASVVLSPALAKQFAQWQLAFNEEIEPFRKDGLMKMLGWYGAVVTGHGWSALMKSFNLASEISDRVKVENRHEKDQPQFMVCRRHFQTIYNDGTMCVCLALHADGARYHYGTGQGWISLFKAAKHQRPV